MKGKYICISCASEDVDRCTYSYWDLETQEGCPADETFICKDCANHLAKFVAIKGIMKTYRVCVTIHNSFDFEAETPEGARAQVHDMTADDILKDCDFNITNAFMMFVDKQPAEEDAA